MLYIKPKWSLTRSTTKCFKSTCRKTNVAQVPAHSWDSREIVPLHGFRLPSHKLNWLCGVTKQNRVQLRSRITCTIPYHRGENCQSSWERPETANSKHALKLRLEAHWNIHYNLDWGRTWDLFLRRGSLLSFWFVSRLIGNLRQFFWHHAASVL